MDISWPRAEIDPGNSPNYDETLRFFVVQLVQRAEGIHSLIALGQRWNTETLLRSSSELFARALRFGYCKPEDRAALMKEYWEDLKELEEVHGFKIANEVKHFIEPGSFERENLESLTKEGLFPSSTELPVHEFRQKWSFSKILDELSKSGDFSAATVLKHQYHYQSTLAHGGPWSFYVQATATANDLSSPRFARALAARQLSEAFWFVRNAYLVSLQAIGHRHQQTDVLSKTTRRFDRWAAMMISSHQNAEMQGTAAKEEN